MLERQAGSEGGEADPGALIGEVARVLADPAATPRVFLITGAHGTDLRRPLRALSLHFAERGAPVPILDLPVLAGAPEAFLVDATAGTRRPLVLIDAVATDPDLVRWWRQAWLPRLPVGTVTVVALRQVDDAWVTDPGWRRLTRVRVAGSEPSLASAPTPRHRAALIVAAMAPRLTEDLLAAVIDRAAGPRIFEWLARLPGFDQAEVGLVPTLATRRGLQAELTDAPRVRRLRLRLLAFHRRRIRRAPVRDRSLWAECLLHLRLTGHPVFASPRHLASHRLRVRPLSRVEGPGFLELVRATGDGPEREGVAEWWLARRPEAIHLCWAPDGGAPLGLMIISQLDPTLADEDAQGPDAGLSAAHWVLRHQLRLAPPDRALFLRGFLGAEPGPAPTAAERALLAALVGRWVAEPRIRVILASVRSGEAWMLAVALGAEAVPLARYRQDGQERMVVAFTRDPRVQSRAPVRPRTHLPRDRFRRAVDVTLRRPVPEALAGSALLTCHHFMPPVPEAEGVGLLVDRLLSGMDDAEATGLEPEAMAALRRLWRDPQVPQSDLAASLGISTRTFRRRLAAASAVVADALWARFVEPGEDPG